MKSLTLNRGAALACARSSLCALTATVVAGLTLPAVALASGQPASGNGDRSISAFENKPITLGATTHPTTVASGGSVVRTIIGLLIVVVVIYGLYWIIKQAKAPKSRAVGEGLEQVATLPLAAGRSVALIRVGGELHLLGIAEQTISPLRIFTEEEAYELGLPMESDSGQPAASDELPPIERALQAMRRFTSR